MQAQESGLSCVPLGALLLRYGPRARRSMAADLQEEAMFEQLGQPDWAAMFALNTPLVELAAPASVLYAVIPVLMRLMARRTGGELATIDLIFLLLIFPAPDRRRGLERFRHLRIGDGRTDPDRRAGAVGLRPEHRELPLPFH